MEIYRKLLKARDLIKNTKVKKEGKNTYSGYEYFTPSQISQLVHSACNEVGLLHLYKLEASDKGYTAKLMLVDIDKPDESIEFEIPTSIPDIKATNEAQKLGGAVTYSERYLLMIAFDIVDNSLDFDTTENTKKSSDKEKKESIKEFSKQNMIPEITAKFDFTKWDSIFLPDNKINYAGKIWTLSDKAMEQLKDKVEHLAYVATIEEQQAKDLDFLNNFGK